MRAESEQQDAWRRRLAGSVAYPNAGFDGKPMAMLSTRYTTYVHVDWNVTQHQVREDVGGLKGYEVSVIDEIDLTTLIPASWRSKYETVRRRPAYTGLFADMPEDPFRIKWCLHVRWRRRPCLDDTHGREALELFYFGGESTLVYEALYTRLGVTPAAIAIIQPGGGLGSAVWTHIESPGGFFHNLVKRSGQKMPEVLLYGGNGHGANEAPCWPEYVATGRAPMQFGEFHHHIPGHRREDGFQASVREYRLRAADRS